ncbi:MAG: hypothetical protein AAGA03_13185 [Planctomycetota bacterium]
MTFRSLAVLATFSLIGAGNLENAFAQDAMLPRAPKIELAENTSPSDRSDRKQTVAQMRQARAMFEAKQRLARIERNAWLGYEPTRPAWAAIPMTTSRYTRPAFRYPIFLYR